jgi:hypothetical protein
VGQGGCSRLDSLSIDKRGNFTKFRSSLRGVWGQIIRNKKDYLCLLVAIELGRGRKIVPFFLGRDVK